MINYFKNEIQVSQNIREVFRKSYLLSPYDVERLDALFSSGMPVEDIRITILLCSYIKNVLEKSRPHIKASDQNETKNPYRLFRELCEGKIRISEKDFRRVYSAIDGIRLDEPKTESKSSSAAAALAGSKLPKNKLAACLYELYITHSPDIIAYNRANPGADTGDIMRAAEAALKSLGNNKKNWLDALCILSADPMSNDISLENTYIYYSYTSRLRDLRDNIKTACIIDPTPFFVRKWIADDYVRHVPVEVYISDPFTVFMLKEFLRNTENAHINDIRQFTIDLAKKAPDVTLMFGNHIFDPVSKAEMIDALISHSRSDHTLMILDTDHNLTSEHSKLCEAVKKTEIRRVDLLPDGINYCTRPKRKMMLSAKYGYLQKNDDAIHVTSLKIVNRSSYQMISSKCTDTYISSGDMFSCSSLRKLFADAEYDKLLKTGRKRAKKTVFNYSEEIVFTYSVRDKAGTPVINVNPYILDPHGKRTSMPQLNLENAPLCGIDPEDWLAGIFPFRTKRKKNGSRISIRGSIAEKLRETYTGSPVTLKTYIYVHPEIERAYSDTAVTLVRHLMDSPLAEMYPRDITAQHISAFLSEYDGKQSLMLTILSDIFGSAVKCGHTQYDPAAEISMLYRDRYEELDEVRTALSKQFLSLEEVRRIISQCERNHDRPEYLAAQLRLLTGLEPAVISALMFKDIHVINCRGEAFHILHTERKLSLPDAAFVPFSRIEQVRDIPLAKLVSDLIEERKNKLQKAFPEITDDKIDSMPIFEGDIRLDASTSVLSPSRINKTSKKLIRSLDISSSTLVVPDNQYGISETDLAKYGGDLFRNTYRHYLVRETDLSGSEINYLLGIKSPDIDYRNYVDCGERNKRKQYRLYCAVQKVSDLFHKEES